MGTSPRKLTFDEVIKTSTVFYVDEQIEEKFNKFVSEKAKQIVKYAIKSERQISIEELIKFLRKEPSGLRRVLNILHLSQEKFFRIITLLRKLEDTFDKEWNLKRIYNELKRNNEFAEKLANLFINGKVDPKLMKYLPNYYRERLNLKSLKEFTTENELVLRLKDQYMATYHNWKGKAIEEMIRKRLVKVGITYSAGKTDLVDVTVDWAIPNLQDPHVIIMSSYQETTSSGQSEKARGMLRCYEAIQHRNIQRGENRAFVNFIDGGGWLARQRDLRRLVDGCHYFLNINTVNMLDEIILRHVPKSYRQTKLI